MADPIHQFEIKKIAVLGHIGGQEIAFTNSALFMLIAVAGISLLMIGATARRQIVPGRLQSVAELTYEFVADMLRSSAGSEGMKFFPFVFCLFTFILFANMIGLIPGTFTVTSHIIITVMLALMVFGTVLVYGIYRNGLKFLKLFVPSGIPIVILPLIVMIELMSFLSRPLSHSVRLFANMLAGHITLKVFASFVTMLGGFGFLGWLTAVLPLSLTVALTALEFLVAFLQAYVFTSGDLAQKENSVSIVYKGSDIHLRKKGIYRFDSAPAELRVLSGEAEVEAGGNVLIVRTGKMVSFDGAVAVEKFNTKEGDALSRWSLRRAEGISMANLSAAKYVQDSGKTWNSNGWYFNPYFGMFTFIPGGGVFNSPYGYRYYSPVAAYHYYHQPQPSYGSYANNSAAGYGAGPGYNTASRTSSGYSGVMASAPASTSTGASSGAMSSGGGSAAQASHSGGRGR